MNNRMIKLLDVYAFVPNNDKNKQIHLFLKIDKDFYSLRDGKKLKDVNIEAFDKDHNAIVKSIPAELQPIGKMCRLVEFFNAYLCSNGNLNLYTVDMPKFTYKQINAEYYTSIKEMKNYEKLWNKKRLIEEKFFAKRQEERQKHNLKIKDLENQVEDTYKQFQEESMEK